MSQSDEELNKTIDTPDTEQTTINDTEDDQNKSQGFYQVIGKVKSGLRKRLQTPLPRWFENCTSFSKDIKSSNDDESYNLNCLASHLDPLLIETCKSHGIDKFFPVQKASIPVILSSLNTNDIIRSRDICVSSPTGSGKTLAFVLPVIQCLMRRVKTRLRAVIILPVRDLAFQVYKVLEDFASITNLKVSISVGHRSFQEDVDCIVKEDNIAGSYRSLIDILVTTPSRLIDLIHSCPGFDLTHLKILVLDEVDRIIDFDIEYNWLQEIDNAFYGKNNNYLCACELPNQGRGRLSCVSGCAYSNYSNSSKAYVKLLFSATLSKDVDNLHTLNLFQPILLMASDNSNRNNNINNHDLPGSRSQVSKDIIPVELEEKFLVVSLEAKPLVLWYMMTKLGYRKVLCFTRTIKHSRLLYNLLKNIPDLRIYEFSSNLKDKQRDAIFTKFKDNDFDLIIATDIMTRGIDIDGIQYVISYDIPYDDIQYVHRIGRTARAGQKGTAITILTPPQVKNFSVMIRKVHPRSEVKERVKKMVIRETKLTPLRKEYRSALKLLKHKTTAAEARSTSFKKSIPWKGLSINKQINSSNNTANGRRKRRRKKPESKSS